MLIGGESTTSLTSSTASFVAVVGTAEVARTEKGDIHVGSTVAELEAALGPFAEDVDRARDPRLVVPGALRNARVLIERDRVSAIVVTAETPRVDVVTGPDCPRPASTERGTGACLLPGSGGELIERDRDEIVVRSIEAETGSGGSADERRSKVIATLRVPNLVFVAPLRNATDGRDELIAISRTDDPQLRTWSIVAYRFDAKQITKVIDPSPLYQLSAAQTRWIGAELPDVELYLELSSKDGIEVGGLLTTRPYGKLRDVVVISPVVIARRHGKSATSEPTDAGPDGRPNAGSARP
ncbi:MAG: hypothetical protein WKG01_09500 [Kofleriaceae bacterium]